MQQLTFLDLCSGIGGFRLGLESAGHRCIGYCEYDRFARASYEAMYDTEGEWKADDVTKLKSEDVPYSSHILDELSRLATHYGFIDNGRMVKEISAEELEESCRKCVRIEVTNVKALVRVLDEMKTDYNIISDNVADIFAKINISKLTLALSKENCEVISMQERDESLESYYVGLVGGKDNE